MSVLSIPCFYYLKWRHDRKNLYKCAENIPGPKGYPLLGVLPNLMGIKSDKIVSTVIELVKPFGTIVKTWLGPVLVIVIEGPEYLKIVLNSDNCLNKAFPYEFLGTSSGLLAAPSK